MENGFRTKVEMLIITYIAQFAVVYFMLQQAEAGNQIYVHTVYLAVLTLIFYAVKEITGIFEKEVFIVFAFISLFETYVVTLPLVLLALLIVNIWKRNDTLKGIRLNLFISVVTFWFTFFGDLGSYIVRIGVNLPYYLVGDLTNLKFYAVFVVFAFIFMLPLCTAFVKHSYRNADSFTKLHPLIEKGVIEDVT